MLKVPSNEWRISLVVVMFLDKSDVQRRTILGCLDQSIQGWDCETIGTVKRSRYISMSRSGTRETVLRSHGYHVFTLAAVYILWWQTGAISWFTPPHGQAAGGHTDAGNDNTWRLYLASGKNTLSLAIWADLNPLDFFHVVTQAILNY